MDYVHRSIGSTRFRRGFRVVSVLFSILGQLKSFGRANLPTKDNFLLLANHVSYIDPFVIATAANQELHFMTRDDALTWPLIGSMLKFFNGYPVKRGTPDLKALKYTISLLNAGKPVLLFPEGTRSVDGQLGSATDGVGFIAKHAQVPTIPAFIGGTEKILSRSGSLSLRTKITVTFGTPLDFSDLATESRRQQYRLISERIMDEIAQLRKQRGYD